MLVSSILFARRAKTFPEALSRLLLMCHPGTVSCSHFYQQGSQKRQTFSFEMATVEGGRERRGVVIN